jgi:hypothetical protein
LKSAGAVSPDVLRPKNAPERNSPLQVVAVACIQTETPPSPRSVGVVACAPPFTFFLMIRVFSLPSRFNVVEPPRRRVKGARARGAGRGSHSTDTGTRPTWSHYASPPPPLCRVCVPGSRSIPPRKSVRWSFPLPPPVRCPGHPPCPPRPGAPGRGRDSSPPPPQSIVLPHRGNSGPIGSALARRGPCLSGHDQDDVAWGRVPAIVRGLSPPMS